MMVSNFSMNLMMVSNFSTETYDDKQLTESYDDKQLQY